MRTNISKRAFSPPAAKVDTVKRTTIRIPNQMVEKINEAMLLDGCNKKQRSKWLNACIQEFHTIDGHHELVLEEFLYKGGNVNIPIILEETSQALLEEIENKVLNYRQEEWEIQDRSLRSGDVQSRIIRSAVVSKLTRIEAKRVN